MSGDLPLDKELATALGADEFRITKEDYELAVLNVYDKAATSDDWLILRTVKGYAGSLWLDVCFSASARLDAGDIFMAAFQHAMREWDISPPPAKTPVLEIPK